MNKVERNLLTSSSLTGENTTWGERGNTDSNRTENSTATIIYVATKQNLSVEIPLPLKQYSREEKRELIVRLKEWEFKTEDTRRRPQDPKFRRSPKNRNVRLSELFGSNSEMVRRWLKGKSLPNDSSCYLINELLERGRDVAETELKNIFYALRKNMHEALSSAQRKQQQKEQIRKEREKEYKISLISRLQKLDYTQSQIGSAVGVDRSLVWRWFTKGYLPRVDQCRRIENFLHDIDKNEKKVKTKKFSKQEKKALILRLSSFDISYRALGKLLDVNESTIARWFAGERFPSLSHAQQIEAFLNDPLAFIEQKNLVLPAKMLQKLKGKT